MVGSGRTVLALLCTAALISLPTLQAAPVNQDSALVAIAPERVVLAQDLSQNHRAAVARNGEPRAVPASIAQEAEPSASDAATPRPDTGTWLWPTPSRVITSTFGFRSDPFNGDVAFHSGLDLGDPCGTPVGTSRPGAVTFAGPAGGYGFRVVVDHGGGVWSSYSHLQEISVQVGDVLTQSHAVGRVGTTGRSTGCHLHFEIILNGGFTDPLPYLTGNPTANPTTFGNGNIGSGPITGPEESASPSPSPSASSDPCEVSDDPQDALDSGGLIPVSPKPGEASTTNPCPTPSASPSPSAASPSPSSPSPSSPSPSSPSPSTDSPSPSNDVTGGPGPSSSPGTTAPPAEATSSSQTPEMPSPSAEPVATSAQYTLDELDESPIGQSEDSSLP